MDCLDGTREIQANVDGQTFTIVGFNVSDIGAVVLDLVPVPKVPTKTKTWDDVCYYVRRIDTCDSDERTMFEHGLMDALDAWKDAT